MPNPSLRDELQALPPTDPAVDKLVEEIIGRVGGDMAQIVIEPDRTDIQKTIGPLGRFGRLIAPG